MKNIFKQIPLTLLLLWLLSGCSVTRHLKQGQYLLRKSSIHLKTNAGIAEKSILADDLDMLKLQKPNTYLFGMFPYKLWLYNLRYKRFQKDTTNFQITNRVVERPVIFDSALTIAGSNHMRDFLSNHGFLYARVKDTAIFKNKRAFVQYYVNTGFNYKIDSLIFEIPDSALAKYEPKLRQGSLFRKNMVYSNVLAGEERERLVKEIRNWGYYKFTVDNISFELDTVVAPIFPHSNNPFLQIVNNLVQSNLGNNHNIDIRTIIHLSDDSLAFHQYHFHQVEVFTDFSDSLTVNKTNYKKVLLNGIAYRFHKSSVHIGALDKKIFIRPGALYAQSDYNQTLRQLNDLGIFRFVRIYITPVDSSRNLLNCYIVMAPNERYNFQTNVEVSGGDLYILGTAANISLTDYNFLKGANQLTTTFSYGLELGRDKSETLPFLKQFYFFSKNVGFNFKLTFPKFLLPVNQSKISRSALPKTFLKAGINSLTRINYFSLRSINGSFGYFWRQSPTKTWNLEPAFVNVLHLSHIYPAFQERMDSIQAIRNSYQETFIEGEALQYALNTAGENSKKYFYMKLGLEEAGALMGALKGVSHIFSDPLSFKNAHYFRLDFDAKQYFVHPKSSLIFRFDGGIGIPYGGSTVLPYIKQYFVGGAYSIRGWRPRVLGPGSYKALTGNTRNDLFIDESGDIKLEWNGEYRFNIFQLFSGAVHVNGAVFADAGNIWLAHNDPKLPGAEFQFNTLYQDIALSSGAGLRLDLGGFLVLRLDWAIPLKKPYVMDSHGWVVRQIDFGSRDWRRQNINLNLAIGYPF